MNNTFLLIVNLLLIFYLIATIASLVIVIKAAEDKGYGRLKGWLIFIGLFGLIFTPWLIVAALPDKKAQESTSVSSTEEELPSI